MRFGTNLASESKRKILHILSGIFFLVILLVFGRINLMVMLTVLLLIGLLIINQFMIGKKFLIIDWFIRNFERPNVRFPGYATAWYASGLLMAATLLISKSEIAAVICALAFGDGISAFFGERGKLKLPYNPEKTLEGVLAFFIAALSSFYFIGWIAIPFAFASAFFESLPLKIDDNFSVPLFGAIFFYIF